MLELTTRCLFETGPSDASQNIQGRVLPVSLQQAKKISRQKPDQNRPLRRDFFASIPTM